MTRHKAKHSQAPRYISKHAAAATRRENFTTSNPATKTAATSTAYLPSHFPGHRHCYITNNASSTTSNVIEISMAAQAPMHTHNTCCSRNDSSLSCNHSYNRYNPSNARASPGTIVFEPGNITAAPASTTAASVTPPVIITAAPSQQLLCLAHTAITHINPPATILSTQGAYTSKPATITTRPATMTATSAAMPATPQHRRRCASFCWLLHS